LVEDTIVFPDEGFPQAGDLTQEVQWYFGSHLLLNCDVAGFYTACCRWTSYVCKDRDILHKGQWHEHHEF
jgi:hypothetical protein